MHSYSNVHFLSFGSYFLITSLVSGLQLSSSHSAVQGPHSTLAPRVTNSTAPVSSSPSASTKESRNLSFEVDATSTPGIWSSICGETDEGPCTAYCRPGDTACLSAATSIAHLCEPSWKSYNNVLYGSTSPGSDWSTITIYSGEPGRIFTTTVDIYTSFSTAKQSFGRMQHGDIAKADPTTFKPVYALGSPNTSVEVTTLPTDFPHTTMITAPTPQCKFTAVEEQSSYGCGRCTLTGGTVELYFWPPEKTMHSGRNATSSSAAAPVKSSVLDGVTLYSPTVYVSIQAINASDRCLQIGKAHTGRLVAMKPEDVTTQIDIGLMEPAYRCGRLNYTDLARPPPAMQYEVQPSCYVFGCPTIYNTRWFPTLVVPPQVRTIDPAWESCALGLEGLLVSLNL